MNEHKLNFLRKKIVEAGKSYVAPKEISRNGDMIERIDYNLNVEPQIMVGCSSLTDYLDTTLQDLDLTYTITMTYLLGTPFYNEENDTNPRDNWLPYVPPSNRPALMWRFNTTSDAPQNGDLQMFDKNGNLTEIKPIATNMSYCVPLGNFNINIKILILCQTRNGRIFG